MFADDTKTIDMALHAYLRNGDSRNHGDVTTLIHVSELNCYSPKGQFILLSRISNNHKHRYPSIKKPSNIIHPKHVTYAEHILYDPFAQENEEGYYTRNYIPPSPRNRIMYFLSTDQNAELYELIKYLLSLDSPDQITYDQNNPKDIPIPRRKRKQSAHLVPVTQHAIYAEVGADFNEQLNHANPSRTLYSLFKEELQTEGIIQWQLHEDNKDVCLVNDINPTTGFMVPGSFVHVTCTNLSNHEVFIQCTCTSFNLIQRAAKYDIDLSPREEIVLNNDMTSMHCHFYHGHLINAYEKVTQMNTDVTTLSRPLQKVHESVQFMNDPVQLARNVIYSETTKFTIVGNDSYSVLN